MKNLIVLITLLLSLDSFATNYADYKECTGVLAQTLSELKGGEGVDVLYQSRARMSEREFNSTPVFNDGFEYESCKKAVKEVSIMDMDGNEFKLRFTHEDECDGGNTYGVVYDMGTGDIVAHINDGELYCL